MQITVLYSRVCLFLLFFSQTIATISLWEGGGCDAPTELFGSPTLDEIFSSLLNLDIKALIILFVLGILLVSFYIIKERRLELNVVWAFSGIAYICLTFTSCMLIGSSESELYGPPSGLDLFLLVGIVIALDIFLIVTRRFIRRHYACANS